MTVTYNLIFNVPYCAHKYIILFLYLLVLYSLERAYLNTNIES